MFPGFNIDPIKWREALAEIKAQKSAVKKTSKPGATCKHCAEFNEYAVADEHGFHECWRCRFGPVR